MAKGMFIGVGGKARKVKKAYVGVGDKARKVKKAWVGVGGVARLCFSSGELSYIGKISEPSIGYNRSTQYGASIGNYAIFNGRTNLGVSSYNASLTESSIAIASQYFFNNGDGGTIGNYAILGPMRINNSSIYASTFNSSLVTSIISPFSYSSIGRRYPIAASNNSYLLYAGGLLNQAGSAPISLVEAISTSLVSSMPQGLSTAQDNGASAVGGNGLYSIFAGGNNDTSRLNIVNAYNTSLTRSILTPLSVARAGLAGSQIGGNAIFAGGVDLVGTPSNVVDMYNVSLTRSTLTPLSVPRYNLEAISIKDECMLIAGGYGSSTIHSTVDSYDSSMTRSTAHSLAVARYNMGSATVGDYALFVNGDSGSYTSHAEAYKFD